jgi:hypothetical protein
MCVAHCVKWVLLLPDIKQIWILKIILVEHHSIKFHENQPSSFLIIMCRQMESHTWWSYRQHLQFRKARYRHHSYTHGEDKSVYFKKDVCCLQVNKNTCGFCLLDYYANKCDIKVSGFVDKNVEPNINFFRISKEKTFMAMFVPHTVQFQSWFTNLSFNLSLMLYSYM